MKITALNKLNINDVVKIIFQIFLDYFDEIIGDLQDRECPTAIEFAAAMLREILVNMKPSHPLWDKIKHAALILHLATRSKNFLTYFNFFHEVRCLNYYYIAARMFFKCRVILDIFFLKLKWNKHDLLIPSNFLYLCSNKMGLLILHLKKPCSWFNLLLF